MDKKDRIAQYKTVQTEALNLFTKKNQDYGDSFATYGPVGVIVRMGDKISRLSSITNSGITLVDNESVRDTLIDLHNYAAMGIMLLDEKKKLENPRIHELKADKQISPTASKIWKEQVLNSKF
tara:strand:- start:119 stop:487 length:369 start_codon:yes stop_codon:yes gene_type:complete